MAELRIIKILFRSLLLAGVIAAGALQASGSEDSEKIQFPRLNTPLQLNVPRDLWHLSDSWQTGSFRVRIGPEGNVLDWIPIELPHYRLFGTLDRALKDARFTMPPSAGRPVIYDLLATIPLYDVVNRSIISVNMSEHIESRMARIVPSQYQLVLSRYEELDQPLKLIHMGDSYNVLDDNGDPLSGTVNVEFYVDPDGFPRMMRSDEAANPLLREAAVMNVANMRFSSPERNGRPTVVKVRLPVVMGD